MASNSAELIIWGVGTIAVIIAFAMIDAKINEKKDRK